jgi:hypothetical protein
MIWQETVLKLLLTFLSITTFGSYEVFVRPNFDLNNTRTFLTYATFTAFYCFRTVSARFIVFCFVLFFFFDKLGFRYFGTKLNLRMGVRQWEDKWEGEEGREEEREAKGIREAIGNSIRNEWLFGIAKTK